MKKYVYLLVITFIFVGCSTSKIRVSKSQAKHEHSKKVVSTQTGKSVISELPVRDQSTESVVLEATSKQTVTNNVVDQYIASYKEIAKNNMVNHKIPASITMAQGILESGSGTGTLAQRANNHFGIKCHTGWTGPSVRHDDDASQECFRKYDDPADSYRDHSLFLTSRSRYNNLFKLNIYDYKAWARGLKAAGYATDPKYPNKLIALIERYNLQELDKEVSLHQVGDNQVVDSQSETAVNHSFPTYVVNPGDTLYSIARKFNTSVQNIKKINNLSSDALRVGQILKI